MFDLIDTVIGFSVVMLLLSFLIKSLTSVITNHLQYYSQNLRAEMNRLLKSLHEDGVKLLEQTRGGIDWRHVGEELLDVKNLKPLLENLGIEVADSDLGARIAIHKEALKNNFARRMKNLSLACGLALCLLLNINAFTIWTQLYEDVNTRSKFSSDQYVEAVLDKAGGEPSDDASSPPPVNPAEKSDEGDEQKGEAIQAPLDGRSAALDREALQKSREEWQAELEHFRAEVDFGIGAVWTDPEPNVLYQLLGSLLTGLLASVGAPYLHDLLSNLSSLRQRKPAPADG